eukprot:GHVU01139301.1.p1 GENE.GHVU01139301.1~~GHVU01139301.1.p1  ORF type:complete len:112 (+),score=11.75 GHVU01139301.1:42-377(+)
MHPCRYPYCCFWCFWWCWWWCSSAINVQQMKILEEQRAMLTQLLKTLESSVKKGMMLPSDLEQVHIRTQDVGQAHTLHLLGSRLDGQSLMHIRVPEPLLESRDVYIRYLFD